LQLLQASLGLEDPCFSPPICRRPCFCGVPTGAPETPLLFKKDLACPRSNDHLGWEALESFLVSVAPTQSPMSGPPPGQSSKAATGRCTWLPSRRS
jgi:hypothetical protein